MKLRLLLVFFIINSQLSTINCFAQKQNNIWIFGDSAGIDFKDLSNPVPISSSIRSWECAALPESPCDSLTSLTPALSKGEGGIQVYPNPFSGSLKFEVLGLKLEKANVFVYDVLGNGVYETTFSKDKSEIDLSFLSQGTYMLSIKTDSHLFSKKIVKM